MSIEKAEETGLNFEEDDSYFQYDYSSELIDESHDEDYYLNQNTVSKQFSLAFRCLRSINKN